MGDFVDPSFLIPDVTLVVEAVVFLIVLFVVTRFVLPRVHATLEARRAVVDDAHAELAAARQRQRDAAVEADRLLTAARQQARRIVDEAYARHDHLVAEGRRKGRAEYDWYERQQRERTTAVPASR